MKKWVKRLSAMLLVIMMVLSLIPTSVFATSEFGVDEAGEAVTASSTEEQTDATVEEQQAEEPEAVSEIQTVSEAPTDTPAETPAETTNEVSMPEQYFDETLAGTDIRVLVTAPEGAFPKDTVMKVAEPRPDAVNAAIEAVEDADKENVVAVDITFENADGTEELQPQTEISVQILTPELEKAEDYSLVHIDDNNNAEVVADEKIAYLSDEGVTFETDAFSVYAVVAEAGSTEDTARATVNFISKDETTIATMYVKNSDTEEDLATIVYDPGVGTLESGEMFKGWTTDKNYSATSTFKSITDVRKDLAGLTISEGQTINYYAGISKNVTVTYLDENDVALGADRIELIGNQESGDITVNMGYTPGDKDENFEGWIVNSGSSNIISAAYGGKIIDNGGTEENPYQNGTVLTINGDVKLSVSSPKGHWLVFDENGKGAKYNAPQFVKNGDKTKEPSGEMERNGYTFGGWYTDKDCTPGNEFTFGQELTDQTTIYAKWTVQATAPYTVIIWKQKLNSDGYDFVESVTFEGNANETVDSVSRQGSGNNAYARIGNRNYQYKGFHLKEFDTNVKIAPEGNSVVNVYYDRTVYTLTFQKSSWFGWETIKTITAPYEENISSEFPIVGTDGKTYDNGERWDPQDSSVYSEVLVYIDIMPAENVTFHLDEATRPLKTINYYIEALDGESGTVSAPATLYDYNNTSVQSGNRKFTLYKSISARYNGVTKAEDFIELVGFSRLGADKKYDKNGFYIYDDQHDGTINFYYTRNKYDINYMDGIYVDGNDIPVEQDSRGQLKVENGIIFGSNLESYNKGGNDYYTPTFNDFTFDGWYLDDSCTQPYTFTSMPEGGITVYAKWKQNQYRVFLHPNAETDSTLDWGSDNQAMNFRISSGGKVSAPNGMRREYEMIGWYLDENCTQVFNADAFVLNDTTVTTPYDKTKDMTDPMDKWGNGATTNADVDRAWITKKLDLYAKWRAVLVGADGIGVIYDANGGDNAPSDTSLYTDQASAVAQAAATAPEGKQFDGWIVQKWNGSGYEDTDEIINPGETFTILKDNAKMEQKEGSTPDNPKYNYTVQLKAKYIDKEEATPTHITWYSNLKDVAGIALELDGFTHDGITDSDKKGWYVTDKADGSLQINEAIDIRPETTYSYKGYTFLGWAKSADATENDLFLKYEDGKFYAQETEGIGDWTVEVTQVAADENQPYDDLYAIWKGSFKVYHSGVAGGNVETIDITENTYDLTATPKGLTPDTLYGGYYLEGGFTAPAAGENENIPAYDGDNWTWTTPQTTSGKSITPVCGETYYIKEVPANRFLQPYTHYTYKTGKNDLSIQDLFMISDIDDLKYKETGFVITTNNKPAQICKSLTVKNAVGGASIKLTPKRVFRSKGASNDDYLTYFGTKPKELGSNENGVTIVQYWVTPDNLMVTGTVQRTLTGVEKQSTIQRTDASVTSTISVKENG